MSRHPGRHRSAAHGRYRGRHSAPPRRRVPLGAASALALVLVTGAGASASAHQHTVPGLTGRGEELHDAERRLQNDEGELSLRRAAATAALAAARGRIDAGVRASRAQARADAERERAQRWVRPLPRWQITSAFGPRWGTTHQGLDVAAPAGTPLRAMSRGTVIKAAWEGTFGQKVEIQYWNGQVSWYAHLSRLDVRAGQSVRAGQIVGAVGNTGRSFGPHLHLEIHPGRIDRPMPPLPWLRERGLA